MKAANGNMKLFMSDDVADATSCPRCNASLEREYHSYMIAIDGEDEREALMIGNNGGLFCPNCPTVVLDLQTVEEPIVDHAQSDDIRYAVIGIVDLDAVPKEKEYVPLGDDDNPIPLIGLEPVSNRSQKRQGPKVGRNDPCPCGNGKKYKKCCMGFEP